MNQIVRQALYFLAGAVPASLGVIFARFAGPVVIAATAGAIGLIIASLMRFPLTPRGYGSIAILLVIGLLAATPVATYFLSAALTGSVSAEEWPSVILIIWLFFGPILCATHFLWAGRRRT